MRSVSFVRAGVAVLGALVLSVALAPSSGAVLPAAETDRELLDAALAVSLEAYSEGVVSVTSTTGGAMPGDSEVTVGVVGSGMDGGAPVFDLAWSELSGVDPSGYEGDYAWVPAQEGLVLYQRLGDADAMWDARVARIVTDEVESLGGSSSSLVPVGVSSLEEGQGFLQMLSLSANPALLVSFALSMYPDAVVTSVPSPDGGRVFTLSPDASGPSGQDATVVADASSRIVSLSQSSGGEERTTVVSGYGPALEVPAFVAGRFDTRVSLWASQFTSAQSQVGFLSSSAQMKATQAAAGGNVTKAHIRAGLRAAGAFADRAMRVRAAGRGFQLSAKLPPDAVALFGPACRSLVPSGKKVRVSPC